MKAKDLSKEVGRSENKKSRPKKNLSKERIIIKIIVIFKVSSMNLTNLPSTFKKKIIKKNIDNGISSLIEM